MLLLFQTAQWHVWSICLCLKRETVHWINIYSIYVHYKHTCIFITFPTLSMSNGKKLTQFCYMCTWPPLSNGTCLSIWLDKYVLIRQLVNFMYNAVTVKYNCTLCQGWKWVRSSGSIKSCFVRVKQVWSGL